MSTLSVQSVNRDGIEPVMSSADGAGDDFPNTGAEFVFVKNGDVAAKNVTIETPRTVDGLVIADRTVTVGAGEEKLIGPFPTATYSTSGGSVNLTYSDVTSLEIAVLKLS